MYGYVCDYNYLQLPTTYCQVVMRGCNTAWYFKFDEILSEFRSIECQIFEKRNCQMVCRKCVLSQTQLTVGILFICQH